MSYSTKLKLPGGSVIKSDIRIYDEYGCPYNYTLRTRQGVVDALSLYRYQTISFCPTGRSE